jgi:hypothetical protein
VTCVLHEHLAQTADAGTRASHRYAAVRSGQACSRNAPQLLAQTAMLRSVPSTKRYFIREARKNHFLRVTDMGADERGGAWSVPRLERFYDVDVSVCGALGKLPIHA